MIIMPYGWPRPHRRSSQARLTSGTSQADASRTTKNRPAEVHGMRQSDEQSRRPDNGTKRAQIGKASGYTHRSFRPFAVHHMYANTAPHRPLVTRADTRCDKKETVRRAAFPQPGGRFRRWWQVLGSNQRRLSRRFYSPLLLPEVHAADQHINRSRLHPGPSPSAMRPWAPGLVHGRG